MKNIFRSLISCCAILCGLFLIIHRNVIAACLTGTEMPEAPEWHQKLFAHSAKKKDN